MGSTSTSVRGLAAIAVVCALACLGAASASAAQLAVVGNHGSGSVSILNTETNQVVGSPIDVGSGPASIAITPDGRYAYVANAFGGSVSVIEPSTGTAVGSPIEVGGNPFGIAITPDGSRVFVTGLGSKVWVIDTRTNQVVGEIEVGGESTGVAVSPDGKLAYVVNGSGGSVDVIDTETMEVVGSPIEVGDHPDGIEFTPDGETAYVVDKSSDEVSAIDTATGDVTPIELEGEEPRGIVVSPDGKKAFVVDLKSNSVSVIDTQTNREVEEIEVGEGPQEVASSANGKTVYVTEAGSPSERTAEVERIDVETGKVVGSPIELPGEYAAGIALTPDQSPIAAFTPPSITAGLPATFSAAPSTDADGTIASYSWAFGDGGTASGRSATHTYRAPGTYGARLSVVDDEGCGEEEVFTGRTAYCSGGASTVTHPVTVKAPIPTPIPPVVTAPSNRFHFGRVLHNRRNGTVRLQVKLPDAGYVLLFGKKVHAVTRKSKGPQSMWLTIHARVELNKRLKKVLRAPVRIRVTFTPNGGEPKTMHRTVVLQRAPRKKHRH
ncbi:MAG TPA: PKD domain-containing protein [Solirubrobacterales bacterium]|nr:PKD domain-containing protein [Solirubrobacterales bacterium]